MLLLSYSLQPDLVIVVVGFFLGSHFLEAGVPMAPLFLGGGSASSAKHFQIRWVGLLMMPWASVSLYRVLDEMTDDCFV